MALLKAKYKCIKISSSKSCDPKSIRIKKIPKSDNKIIIGCPKGYWNDKKKKCLIGTKAISILKPKTKQNKKEGDKSKMSIIRRTRRLNRYSPCRRRNIEMGYYDAKGFHPIRASKDYEPKRVKEAYQYRGGELQRLKSREKALKYWRDRYKYEDDLDRLDRVEDELFEVQQKLMNLKDKMRAKKEAKPKAKKEVKPKVKKEAKPKAKTKEKTKIKKNIPVFLANKPVTPVVEVYPKVEKIFATKTKGDAKGKYYHTFKKGVKAYGLSDGSVLLTTKKLKTK